MTMPATKWRVAVDACGVDAAEAVLSSASTRSARASGERQAVRRPIMAQCRRRCGAWARHGHRCAAVLSSATT
jgi:hypothetical protein